MHLLNNNIGHLVQTGYNISSKRKFGNNVYNTDVSKLTIANNNNELVVQKELNLHTNDIDNSNKASSEHNSIEKNIENSFLISKSQVKKAEKQPSFSIDANVQNNLISTYQNDKVKTAVSSIFDDIEDSNKTPNPSLTMSGTTFHDESTLEIKNTGKSNILIKSASEAEAEAAVANANKDDISRIFHDPAKEKIESSFDNLVLKLNQELIKTNDLLNKIKALKK